MTAENTIPGAGPVTAVSGVQGQGVSSVGTLGNSGGSNFASRRGISTSKGDKMYQRSSITPQLG